MAANHQRALWGLLNAAGSGCSCNMILPACTFERCLNLVALPYHCCRLYYVRMQIWHFCVHALPTACRLLPAGMHSMIDTPPRITHLAATVPQHARQPSSTRHTFWETYVHYHLAGHSHNLGTTISAVQRAFITRHHTDAWCTATTFQPPACNKKTALHRTPP